jgi:hypothetical protein
MFDSAAINGKRRVLAFAAALAVGTSLAAISGEPADGAKNSRVIGPTEDRVKPTCPKDCNAFGHVTGFQLRTDNERAVHKVRRDGHIVAWSIDLGNTKDQETLNFFRTQLKDETYDRYGGDPVANLAVLKKKQGSKGRFVLGKQTPIVPLKGSLGEKPIFTLQKPMKVQKGRILALSTPTWALNFAIYRNQKQGRPLSANNKWRASRRPSRCEGEDLNNDGRIRGEDELRNLTKRSKPQFRKGSTRRYGCIYSGAQILYWAYFVPQKKGKKG